MREICYYLSFAEIRQRLGMVIPVWFSSQVQDKMIRRLLMATLSDFPILVSPERLLLVVDGPQRAAGVVEGLQAEFRSANAQTFRMLCLPENIGKGGAVAKGIEQLLDDDSVEMIMVRDADGDHFINDGANLARLGAQIADEHQTANWIVIGGRVDAHRPLGFIRGEYETIVNSLLWHSCLYYLAQEGKTINTQHFAAYGEVPDCESGYKLYGRQACEILVTAFSNLPQQQPEIDVSRWCSEVTPLVEVLVHGGVIGQVPRLTYNEQPTSSYHTSGRAEAYAQRVSWLFRRLSIPPEVARQLMDNALSRSLLLMEKTGRQELLTFRASAMRYAYGEEVSRTLTPYLHGSFLC